MKIGTDVDTNCPNCGAWVKMKLHLKVKPEEKVKVKCTHCKNDFTAFYSIKRTYYSDK